MRRSAPEIGLIGLLLFLLFFVYAIVGTLLFGHLLPYFSTLFTSFQSNIEMALGADFDIMDMAKGFIDIPSASEGKICSNLVLNLIGVSIIPLAFLPVMYKWSLMILMTFVLINIFVAVVTNAYDLVKDDMHHIQYDDDYFQAEPINPLVRLFNAVASLNIRARWNRRNQRVQAQTTLENEQQDNDDVEFRRL
jgi:hypothetical protein